MFGFGALQILNESVVDIDKIVNAINGHKRIVISYNSEDKGEALGPRLIEIYAFGQSKKGNPVIRAFEPYGDSLKTGVPKWKFFRLDRINYWYDTGQTFNQPANEEYDVAEFNPDGDKSMSVVYNIAHFDNEETNNNLFMTDTERRLAKLRNSRVKGTYNMNDIKIDNAFKNIPTETNTSDGPKMKPNTEKTPQQIEKEIEIQNNDIEEPENNEEEPNVQDLQVNYNDNSSSGPKLKQTNNSTTGIEGEEENGPNNLTTYYQRQNLLDKLKNGEVRKIQLSDKDLNKRRF